GFSTLITSAPSSPRIMPANGAAMLWPISTTTRPDNGRAEGIGSPPRDATAAPLSFLRPLRVCVVNPPALIYPPPRTRHPAGRGSDERTGARRRGGDRGEAAAAGADGGGDGGLGRGRPGGGDGAGARRRRRAVPAAPALEVRVRQPCDGQPVLRAVPVRYPGRLRAARLRLSVDRVGDLRRGADGQRDERGDRRQGGCDRGLPRRSQGLRPADRER